MIGFNSFEDTTEADVSAAQMEMQKARQELKDTRAALAHRVDALEQALRSIAALHPDPDMCAELVPEWVGPNEGRMRAETLWYALNTARKALGLPTYPEPEHWKKKAKP